MNRRVALLVLILVLVTGCAPARTATPRLCTDIAAGYVEESSGLFGQFSAAFDRAATASDANFLFALDELQELRIELNELNPPDCVRGMHVALGTAMDHTIRGFTLAARGSSDREVAAKFEAAQESLDTYVTQLDFFLSR